MSGRAAPGAGRLGKYGNRPTMLDGVRFDSAGEAKRWLELCTLERAGRIVNLRRQEPYVLQDGARSERVTLVLDFAYTDLTGPVPVAVAEDFKGLPTDVFKLKLKLFRRQYPHIRVVLSGRRTTTVLEPTA